MIYFKLRLTNPWSPSWKLLKNFNGQITRTKAWEFNVYHSNEVLGIEFEYTLRTDHAGLGLTLSFFNFCTIKLSFSPASINFPSLLIV